MRYALRTLPILTPLVAIVAALIAGTCLPEPFDRAVGATLVFVAVLSHAIISWPLMTGKGC